VLALGPHLCNAGDPVKPVQSPADAVGAKAGAPAITNQLSLAVKLRPPAPEVAPAATEKPAPTAANPKSVISERPRRSGSIFDLFSSSEPNLAIKGIEAGYGQAYDAETVSLSLRRRNGGTLEEPRYLFIKTCMKF
jgi:hypothetical protein